MSSFKVGDRVKISDSADHVELGIPRRMRAIVGTVIEVDRGAIDVRFPGLSDIYEFHATDLDMVESKSLPTTETHVKALRQKYGTKARPRDKGPLGAVVVTMLARAGIPDAKIQFFPGDDGGYKITVNSVKETFKAEEVRKEIEQQYGVPVYVAY